MAPTLKFTYFPSKGLGEHIRLLLKYGEVDFEDVRVEHADWPSLRPSTPFGQLPLIEEDGKVSGQSLAIARYVAKKVKLVGESDWEDLEIDAIVDTLNDFKNKLLLVAHEKDSQAKENLKQKFLEDTVPFYFERLNKKAKENNGYLATNKLTWADFYFTTICDSVATVLGKDILQNYPNLENTRNNVLEIPTIKAWIEIRPKTQF